MNTDYILRVFPAVAGFVYENKVHTACFLQHIKELFGNIDCLETQGNINRQIHEIEKLLETSFGRKTLINNMDLKVWLTNKIMEINYDKKRSPTTQGMCLKVLYMI